MLQHCDCRRVARSMRENSLVVEGGEILSIFISFCIFIFELVELFKYCAI